MRLIFDLCFTFILLSTVSCKLEEFIKWQTINFKNIPNSGDPSIYNASAVVPFGVAHYRNRIFISVPRRGFGIPSTLNVVELNGAPPHLNPLLVSFPNYQTNALNPRGQPDKSKLISIYRVRVDRCQRLWFVDTGVLEYPNNVIVVQRPAIYAIDLLTDTIFGRFEIPISIVPDGRGLASITLDDDDCANTFAYLPDWFNRILIVFSATQDRAWRFEHNFFHFNPFEGDFSVDGQTFQWTDGIFSIALSSKKLNGFKTAFFHALSSQGEFTVSTEVLKNEQLLTRLSHGKDFKFLGQRGANSQSGSHALDLNTNVMFFTQMQRNAVTCWNVHEPLKPANIHIVEQNNATLIYTADLTIDLEGSLYVINNRFPRVLYSQLNENEYNFNIHRGLISDVIAGTSCLAKV